MTQQAKLVIAALVLAVAVLAVALGMALSSDDNGGMPHMGSGGGGYMGMMQAFGGMDSGEMLEAMRDVLGSEGYQRMLDHIAEHRRGGGMPGQGMDGMMHQMMDGMMRQMPADEGNVMPMTPR